MSGDGTSVLDAVKTTGSDVEPPKILHRYVGFQGERVPGGFKALCGHVKREPDQFSDLRINRPGYQVCAICLNMYGAAW